MGLLVYDALFNHHKQQHNQPCHIRHVRHITCTMQFNYSKDICYFWSKFNLEMIYVYSRRNPSGPSPVDSVIRHIPNSYCTFNFYNGAYRIHYHKCHHFPVNYQCSICVCLTRVNDITINYTGKSNPALFSI